MPKSAEPGPSFVAFDFETANYDPGGATTFGEIWPEVILLCHKTTVPC